MLNFLVPPETIGMQKERRFQISMSYILSIGSYVS